MPDKATNAAFDLAATAKGLGINAIAYKMKVEKSGIVDGKDIGPAPIRMSVPSAWILEHGRMENIRIVRLSDEGVSQILNTRSAGLDNKLGIVFISESPDGLSLFAVISVNPSAAPPVVATSPVGLATHISNSIPAIVAYPLFFFAVFVAVFKKYVIVQKEMLPA